jgi:arylsulfatase A-like enzyme
VARQPNILIAMSDHHTGYALGSEAPYRGHPPVHTPVMDRLVREGMSFAEARTPTPMCAPARAALMSGLYPHANGMWNNNHTPAAMRRDIYRHVPLWSEGLRAAGYRLQYLGKWHVSDVRSPADFGWEEPNGPAGRRPGVGTGPADRPRPRPPGYLDRGAGEGRGDGLRLAMYQERPGWPRRVICAETEVPPEASRDGRLTARAVELIEGQARAGRSDQPWCLYVGWSNPHDPYVVHGRYLQQYDAEATRAIPRLPSHDDDLRDKPNIYRRLHEQLWGHLSWPEMAQVVRHYCAMITFLDEQLGQLLAALERTGQAEDTLVISTRDHGDYVGTHGLFAKGVAAFDEAYRVPLLVRWPAGIVHPGRRVDSFVSLMDIGPTLLELAGAPPLSGIHGRSLVPFLGDETPAEWPDAFFGEFLGHENFYTQRQVRTRQIVRDYIEPRFGTLTIARNGRPFAIAAMMSADSSGEWSSGIGSEPSTIALTWTWDALSMS